MSARANTACTAFTDTELQKYSNARFGRLFHDVVVAAAPRRILERERIVNALERGAQGGGSRRSGGVRRVSTKKWIRIALRPLHAQSPPATNSYTRFACRARSAHAVGKSEDRACMRKGGGRSGGTFPYCRRRRHHLPTA